MRNYWIIIICVLFNSCVDRNSENQFDFKLASKIIIKNNLQDSSMLILESKQGIFAFDSLPNDTCNISYSGLGIGQVIIPPDSLKKFWDNIYDFEEAPGLFDLTSNWRFENITGIPVLLNNQIKNYLIKSDTENIYSIDWEKLGKKGIRKLCSFSEPIINDEEKIGYAGYQIFSKENFSVNVIYFDFTDSLKINEFKNMNFNILDLKCSFSNGILKEFEPNRMIVN